jgi:hypothetical protein
VARGSGVRIETQASDWLTLVDKITKNSKCIKQQHFELYSFNIIRLSNKIKIEMETKSNSEASQQKRVS